MTATADTSVPQIHHKTSRWERDAHRHGLQSRSEATESLSTATGDSNDTFYRRPRRRNFSPHYGVNGCDEATVDVVDLLVTHSPDGAAKADRAGAGEHATPVASPELSEREKEVLIAWLKTNSKVEVARRLYIAESTVRTHIERIRSKYEAVGRNASTKAALTARAIQDQLIAVDDL